MTDKQGAHTPGPWPAPAELTHENALRAIVETLHSHKDHWEHSGDDETGVHDEDCRACEYEAMYAMGCAALEKPNSHASLTQRVGELEAALRECEAYLEDHEDVVDGDYGVPAPNKEMRLLYEVRAALARGKP